MNEALYYHELINEYDFLMNSYKLSNGETITKRQIDNNIKKAKKEFLKAFFDKWGYYFCERDLTTSERLDISHIISVKEAQNMGESELAWDLDNLELLSRESHEKIESWANAKRKEWYYAKKENMSFDNFLFWHS